MLGADLGAFFGCEAEPGTLREKAERRLFEVEALAALMAADVGQETPRGRLLACRWAAARALLLEVLEAHDPAPPEMRPLGSPWERAEETGLLGALCQRYGWRCVRPGVLVRREGVGRG